MRCARVAVAALLAVGLGCAATAPAFAVGQSAAHIPDGKMSEGDRGRVTARALADCVVKEKPKWVDRALAVPNPDSNRMIGEANLSECLDRGQLRFQASLLRGALFGAKYRSVYATADTAPSMVPDAVTFYAQDRSADPGYYSTLWIADCVVAKNAHVVRDVVLTRPVTAENDQAYRALLPVLAGCMVKDVTARFSKATLDGFLSEALYRRTAAAAARVPTEDR